MGVGAPSHAPNLHYFSPLHSRSGPGYPRPAVGTDPETASLPDDDATCSETGWEVSRDPGDGDGGLPPAGGLPRRHPGPEHSVPAGFHQPAFPPNTMLHSYAILA